MAKKRFQRTITVKGNQSPTRKEYAMCYRGEYTIWTIFFKENEYYTKEQILESFEDMENDYRWKECVIDELLR